MKRSSTTRSTAVCKSKGCKFEARDTSGQAGGVWRVTKVVDQHNFQLDLSTHGNHNFLNKIIYELIAPKLIDHCRVYRPKDFIFDLKKNHGVELLYSKAWRPRERAERSMFGDAKTSYQLLLVTMETVMTIIFVYASEEKSKFNNEFANL